MICYAVGLLQYSKSAWSNVGNHTFDLVRSYISKCLKIVSEVDKGTNWTPSVFTIFSSSEVLYIISLHHNLLESKYLNSIKKEKKNWCYVALWKT